MNTLSIGRYTMAPLTPTDPTQATDAATGGLDGAGKKIPPESRAYTAVTIEFSPAAQLYGKLDHLSQVDPSRFKKVMGEMADGLWSVADQGTGANSRAINNLANEFAEASKTGKPSPLAPSSLPASFKAPYGASAKDQGSDILAQAVGFSQSPTGSYLDNESDSANLSQLGALFSDLLAKITPDDATPPTTDASGNAASQASMTNPSANPAKSA